MKRTILCIILCFLLILPLPARAAVFQDIQYVVDQADILTDQENIYLNNRASEISSTHGVDVLIAIVEDMGGESAGDYAASLNGSRFWWDTDDAILFLLAMEEREWYIATFGTAISVFSDRTLDHLGIDAAETFSLGSYYNGFSDYLSDVEACFLNRKSGEFPESFDSDCGFYGGSYEPEQRSIWTVLPSSLLIGLVAATVSLIVMRSAMNSKRKQPGAQAYLKNGSFHLRSHQDIFLYSSLSKTRRQQNTGGTGGPREGGSTIHSSSGGRSHGGRGGKF